jgi:hypothetical protein
MGNLVSGAERESARTYERGPRHLSTSNERPRLPAGIAFAAAGHAPSARDSARGPARFHHDAAASCARSFEPKPIAGKPRMGRRRPKATGSPGIRRAKWLTPRRRPCVGRYNGRNLRGRWPASKGASQRQDARLAFTARRQRDASNDRRSPRLGRDFRHWQRLMHYCAIKPPSITNSVPVTNEASSEARNNAP